MTKSFVVMLDPLTNADAPFEPPVGVDGGVMGDTDKGLMAIYRVPDELVQEFTAAVVASPVVLRYEPITR